MVSAGLSGHPDRLGGRPVGAVRRDQRRIPADYGANLHRAPEPQQPGFCGLEGQETAGSGVEPDLHRRER